MRYALSAMLVLLLCGSPLPAQEPALTAVSQKLAQKQPVKIVCLGDSVTGIYYHTGGRRAYPEMLALALQRALPDSPVSVVNAGISGNTTADGLKRLQKDVLDHKPDLVTVMFGLNDMSRVPLADFQNNLQTIATRCREIGAEVLFCTPNGTQNVLPKLEEFNAGMKRTAAELQIPVCDVYAAYEKVRAADPLAFRMLLSDPIHPNMAGHKINAEEICRSITNKTVSLADVGPPAPPLPRTLQKLKAGDPVRVLAMSPVDQLIAPILTELYPQARIEVQSWPTADQSLAQLEAAAKAIRGSPPDLVIIAVPYAALPAEEMPSEQAIHSLSWIMNYSLSFGLQQWDVLTVAPSVLAAPSSPEETRRNAFAQKLMYAQDLGLVSRKADDAAPAQEVLAHWFKSALQAP